MMKKALELLAKHGPPIFSVLLLVVCALAFFRHYWADASKAQVVGAVFGFLASAILLGVTWEYVLINQKSLSLLKLQWEQQNRVVVKFGIKRYHGKAQLWVANPGKTDFLVSELLVRMKDGPKIVKNERRVVRSGSREILALPDKLWARDLRSTFDIRLCYESQHDSGTSPGKAFTLIIGDPGVLKVWRGIQDIWSVHCLRCGEFGGVMITENLDNFDDADSRQLAMESELSATCPSTSHSGLIRAETRETRAT